MKTCQIHKLLRGIECELSKIESDPNGLCLMHSRNQNKDKDAFQSLIKDKIRSNDYNFQGYFFPIIAFNEETFYNANFSYTIFYNYVSFEKAIFNGRTIFTCSIWLDDVNFSGATFNGHTDFRFVTFSEKADFSFTKYNKSALFLMANFLGYSRFWFSSFIGNVEFEYVSFMGFANFRGLRIENKLSFSWINYGLIPNEFEGDFSILEIHKQGTLAFEHLSLAKIRFQDTDLRVPQFYHVTWQNYWWRNAIDDEIKIHRREIKKISNAIMQTSYLADVSINEPNIVESRMESFLLNYAHVEKLYRELKINYERQEDYKNAGDFHYGEMEMHRRASRWGWFPLNWYFLYRFLSGYGERPSWALGWLALFLFGLAGLVWSLGLEIGQTQQLAGFNDAFIYWGYALHSRIYYMLCFTPPMILLPVTGSMDTAC